MNAEQRVKQVHPQATIGGFHDTFGTVLVVFDKPHGEEIGRCPQRRRSWAWADAWRRIQQRSGKKEE